MLFCLCLLPNLTFSVANTLVQFLSLPHHSTSLHNNLSTCLQYTCEQICQASTDLSLSVSRMVSSCFAVLRQIRSIRRSVSQYTPHLARELCRVADMDCRRRLRSASTLELHVPLTCRVTVGDRAFAVSAARVWNGRVCHLTLSRRHR